jgi:subtilase family serine protease
MLVRGMGHRVIAAAAAGVMCIAGLAAAPAASAAAAPARTTLAASAPKWLPGAVHQGTAAAKAAVSARVYLTPRGGLAAQAAAVAAVSTPGSAQYRYFLSSAQYQDRYEPTSTTVATVSKWLTSAGLKVTGVESEHRYLSVTGDVSAAQKAFAVSIAKFAHAGQQVQAPAGNLSVPSAVASAVLGVDGLDTTVVANAPSTIAPPAAFNNARPCSTFYGQLAASVEANFTTPLPKYAGKTLPYAVCGYTGAQLRGAYEGATTLTGAEVTVGITDAYASPTIVSDIATYARNNGDAPYAAGQFTQTDAKSSDLTDLCDASGWFGEESLDIEAVHAMAPAAKIHYYGAQDCAQPLNDTLAKAVDDDQVQVLSNSWGDLGEVEETTAGIAAFDQTARQAALEGISLMFSSGDDGDSAAALAANGLPGGPQPDFPASDPNVTAVGGTSTAIGPSDELMWQTGWGVNKSTLAANGKSWTSQGFLYGAGGGYSTLFNRPSYQNGVVAPSAPAGRAVPDISMDADPTTGMLIGQTQLFSNGAHYGQYRIGGTSLASPLFAGITALSVQHAKGRLGLLNWAIYSRAKSGSSTIADVRATGDAGNVRPDYVNGVDAANGILYSVRSFDQDSSLVTTKGWDDVTGVGVPTHSWAASFAPEPVGS